MTESIDFIVNDKIDFNDLIIARNKFKEACSKGLVNSEVYFEYAYSLIKSRKDNDIKEGSKVLKELFQQTHDEDFKRDTLFYLSIACIKLNQYVEAKKYADAILYVQPLNQQALDLKMYIETKMKKEGLIGLAVVGGTAAVAIGALVGLGVALVKKK